jgi:hypothetical protein
MLGLNRSESTRLRASYPNMPLGCVSFSNGCHQNHATTLKANVLVLGYNYSTLVVTGAGGYGKGSGALIEGDTGYKLIVGTQDSCSDGLNWDHRDYPCGARTVRVFGEVYTRGCHWFLRRPACLIKASRRVANAIPLWYSRLLPTGTLNSVQTLKVRVPAQTAFHIVCIMYWRIQPSETNCRIQHGTVLQ